MTPTQEMSRMYFHLMCKVPCIHRLNERMDSDELIHHLTAQNLHIADSQSLYWARPQVFVQQLHDEAAQKTFQTAKTLPHHVWFLPFPCGKRNTIKVCAITQVPGKDEFYFFSHDFTHVEFFAKRDFPLTVW